MRLIVRNAVYKHAYLLTYLLTLQALETFNRRARVRVCDRSCRCKRGLLYLLIENIAPSQNEEWCFEMK